MDYENCWLHNRVELEREGDTIMMRQMSLQTMGTAIVDTLSPNGASSYEPLSSVWEGSDGDLLEAMLKFYPTILPEPILDATYNAGMLSR